MLFDVRGWVLAHRESLVHGVVIVGLVAATVASSAALGGSSPAPRHAVASARTIATAERALALARVDQVRDERNAQARSAVGQAAQVALAQAQDARAQAAAASVDPAQLVTLDAATSHLQSLLEQATAVTGGSHVGAPVVPGVAVAAPAVEPSPATTGASVQPTARPTEEPTTPVVATPTTAVVATPAPTLEVTTPQTMPDPYADQASILDVAPTVVDQVRSYLPESTGQEDATTVDLRAAVDVVAQTVADVSAATLATVVASQVASAAQQAAAQQAAARQAAVAAAARSRTSRLAKDAHSLDQFPNGQVPLPALCSPAFDLTAYLRCDAAEMLDGLDRAFKVQFGHDLEVSDSYRTLDAQIQCTAEKGSLCADPGTSNHGLGIAVDLGGEVRWSDTPEHAWMLANCGAYGWVKPAWSLDTGSKPEPWHFDFGGVPTG